MFSQRENHQFTDHGQQNTRQTSKPPLYNHVWSMENQAKFSQGVSNGVTVVLCWAIEIYNGSHMWLRWWITRAHIYEYTQKIMWACSRTILCVRFMFNEGKLLQCGMDEGYYRKTSKISRTLVGNKIVDNSDVVGASPVGAAPTTSSIST